MKNLIEYLTEANSDDRSWNLWDYMDDGIREILIWKSGGVEPEQSDVTELDENGKEIMNTSFEEVIKYCEEHKDDKIDKFHLDFSNAKWNKIKDIF